jgi:hypothetical protein
MPSSRPVLGRLRACQKTSTLIHRAPAGGPSSAQHRLSRAGNRRLDTVAHRIAITQADRHQPADLIARREPVGYGGLAALDIPTPHLSTNTHRLSHADILTHPPRLDPKFTRACG